MVTILLPQLMKLPQTDRKKHTNIQGLHAGQMGGERYLLLTHCYFFQPVTEALV